MQISQIEKKFKLHDKQIWRLIENYDKEAISRPDFSTIITAIVDETSGRKDMNVLFLPISTQVVLYICK